VSRSPLRRLGIAVTAVAALTLAACGGSADSGGTTAASDRAPLAISVATSAGSVPGLPMIIAKETGIFAKHGLDATVITNLRGGAALLSALTSGSVDVVAHGVANIAQADQQGAKVRMLFPSSIGIPYDLVVGPKFATTPVATNGPNGWQDTIRALKGATIAASGPGTTFDLVLKSLYQDAGLAPTDFSNVNIAHGGPELAALQQGQVDVVLADPGSVPNLISGAGGRVVLDLSKQGPDYASQQAYSGLNATEATLAAKPQLTERFQAAMKETQDYIKNPANLKEIRRIAVDVSKIPDTPELDAALTAWPAVLTPTFTQAQMQTTLDFLVRSGQLKPDPAITPKDLVAPGVLSS
jgi:NitT/TauT family transport system substrate-binding protein